MARPDAGLEHVNLQFRRRLESHLQSDLHNAGMSTEHTRLADLFRRPRRKDRLISRQTSRHHEPNAFFNPRLRVPGYAVLQREMHDALRAQHPEWIQTDGNSPRCDSYESRLAELLTLSLATERVHFTLANKFAISVTSK